MRADMAKLIVERPRLRGGTIKGRRNAVALEDLPSFESMGRRHGRTKTLNDYLAPLRRFLHSRIGQRWDAVYAEIRAHIRPRSTVQQHILEHVFGWVAHRTRLAGDTVVVHVGGFIDRGPRKLEDSRFELYVHPVSGQLLRNRIYDSRKRWRQERLAREAVEREAKRRDLSSVRQLHKLRGLWFEVTLAAASASAEPLYDVVRDAGLSPLAAEELYGRRQVHAAAKRQLNRRELKTYGLRNDAED
jgi:hypothetical protein